MLPPLPAHEALSGVSGSISLACWLFVLVPQLFENYRTGKADGISLWFLAVWFVGDITNFVGALWAGLVPTVIALAVYFCIADTVLILQCLFYKYVNAQKTRYGETSQVEADDPSQPLLSRRLSDIGLPGSRRRSSASHRQRNGSDGAVSLPTISEDTRGTQSWIKNTVAVVAVCAIGAAGWAIARNTGVWQPTTGDDDNAGTVSNNIGASILGYISAVCYLGARIPQIIKNFREKSCEGLAILFFILSLAGNLTYGGGILFHSTSNDYIVTNLPWLIGSLGTIGEDILIFVQFRIYNGEGDRSKDHTMI